MCWPARPWSVSRTMTDSAAEIRLAKLLDLFVTCVGMSREDMALAIAHEGIAFCRNAGPAHSGFAFALFVSGLLDARLFPADYLRNAERIVGLATNEADSITAVPVYRYAVRRPEKRWSGSARCGSGQECPCQASSVGLDGWVVVPSSRSRSRCIS
jgi:hypothetical protein